MFLIAIVADIISFNEVRSFHPLEEYEEGSNFFAKMSHCFCNKSWSVIYFNVP